MSDIAELIELDRDHIALATRYPQFAGRTIGDLTRRIAAKDVEIAKLREALDPFAKAGQVIDGPFGPALFAEDDMAFRSGCAWSENGEKRTITWGDFRRARAALAKAGEA